MDRRVSRLGLKLVGASLLALALALAVYCLVSGYGAAWLLRSEWFTALLRERQVTSVQAYQAYVIESGMSVRQVLEEPGWEGADPSTTIYSVVVGDWEEEGAVAVSMSQMSTDGSVSIYMEPLRCADGELYLTAAPNWAWLEGLVRIAALVLAAAVFCAVVVPYILHLLRRIEALSRETGALMAGDLSHSIRAPGRDELSRLGADIERLRLSVLERLEGEREAVGATGRLITGLSHDLRTPLTKLMGYLEILRRCQSGEEREKYLRLAAEKAEQIKGMTDQLFDRAQVPDSREALAREPELVDGAQLLGQILSEVCGDLQREGFQAPQPVFTEPFRLYLRPEDAVRVFDNLFSNLCKYGDPASPVTFSVERGPGTVTVAAENRVRPDPDRRDSHGVGLPTMSELMERCGGRLETERRGETFRTAAVFAVSGDMR
ncbi:MAG: HAMP domain-containing histidine kinase [Oscillospiraceae bacterium]|nr:HAMP domain-containing histidine kinase [Oscillospiraceae bacterium]